MLIMIIFQEKLGAFKGGSSDVVMSTLSDKALIALQGTYHLSYFLDDHKMAASYNMYKLYFSDVVQK